MICVGGLKTRSGKSPKSQYYRDAIVFPRLRFQNVFRPHENEKPHFSNSSGFKSIFEKLRFRDGLVWTVGLTKLRFQISPAKCVDAALCLPYDKTNQVNVCALFYLRKSEEVLKGKSKLICNYNSVGEKTQ